MEKPPSLDCNWQNAWWSDHSTNPIQQYMSCCTGANEAAHAYLAQRAHLLSINLKQAAFPSLLINSSLF